MNSLPIARVILYVQDIQKVASCYQTYFGMTLVGEPEKGWLELASSAGGSAIALHQAAKSQKSGAAVKIVFGVDDVEAFVSEAEERGLKFGPIHRPGKFHVCQCKRPAGKLDQCFKPGI